MHKLPRRKPDCCFDNAFLSSRNLKSLLKKNFSKIFITYKQNIYWSIVWRYLFIILLVDKNNICSFPQNSKCTSSQTVLTYQSKGMSERVSAKLHHSNRNIIIAIFEWMRSSVIDVNSPGKSLLFETNVQCFEKKRIENICVFLENQWQTHR